MSFIAFPGQTFAVGDGVERDHDHRVMLPVCQVDGDGAVEELMRAGAKPRLAGADAEGNPFVITADSAVQDAHNPKKASLKNLEADLSLDNHNWINARANTGMVDMNTGQLELSGGIDVFTATGYELHSNSASANLKQSIVHGHEKVTGQGPQGTLRADEFHADRTTNILTLNGHVQMTLTGTKK